MLRRSPYRHAAARDDGGRKRLCALCRRLGVQHRDRARAARGARRVSVRASRPICSARSSTTTLAASKVDASLAIRSNRPTTLAFVTLTDGQAQYAFYDENTAGRMIAVDDLPGIPETVEALFFGGISLPPDPCGATYEALMLREAAPRVTMIDPNIRPGFITDEPRLPRPDRPDDGGGRHRQDPRTKTSTGSGMSVGRSARRRAPSWSASPRAPRA